MSSRSLPGVARAALVALAVAHAPAALPQETGEEGAAVEPSTPAVPLVAGDDGSAHRSSESDTPAAAPGEAGIPAETKPAAEATPAPPVPAPGTSSQAGSQRGSAQAPGAGALESLGVEPAIPPPRASSKPGDDHKAAPPTPAPARARAAPAVLAAPFASPGIDPRKETAQALRIVLGLTVLAIAPALLVCLTSFLRIIIVLSMLRHAIGMNETPPNMVLTGLALFLTLFTMSPVLQKMNDDAFQPFLANRVSMEDGYRRGMAPLREFMVRQTREQDLALMVEISKASPPRTMDDVSSVQLVPAYMLSELRAAFQIGFVVFLPFLLIDLVVSSILMSLGMMMMPPTTISLPLKILMFVLIDGWSLLLKALVGSFH